MHGQVAGGKFSRDIQEVPPCFFAEQQKEFLKLIEEEDHLAASFHFVDEPREFHVRPVNVRTGLLLERTDYLVNGVGEAANHNHQMPH